MARTLLYQGSVVSSRHEGLPAVDGEGSVRFLVDGDLKALGLSQAELSAQAKKNLARTTSVEMLRGGLTALLAVNTGDSFDAARLLLVPDALRPGEAVAASVPDRDLLILSPVPPGDVWASLGRAARSTRKASSQGTPASSTVRSA